MGLGGLQAFTILKTIEKLFRVAFTTRDRRCYDGVRERSLSIARTCCVLLFVRAIFTAPTGIHTSPK